MRIGIALALVIIIVTLDWAALQDIIKGEPDPTMEIAFLAISPVLIILALWWGYKKSIKK